MRFVIERLSQRSDAKKVLKDISLTFVEEGGGCRGSGRALALMSLSTPAGNVRLSITYPDS